MQTVSSALMEAVFTGLWLDLKMKAIMTENNLKPNKIAVCFFVIFFFGTFALRLYSSPRLECVVLISCPLFALFITHDNKSTLRGHFQKPRSLCRENRNPACFFFLFFFI